MREKLRKKSEGQEGAKGGGKIFYREEKNGKVTYEFNATYRKPSDLGWVSAAAAEQQRARKRSQNEEPESPGELIEEDNEEDIDDANDGSESSPSPKLPNNSNSSMDISTAAARMTAVTV